MSKPKKLEFRPFSYYLPKEMLQKKLEEGFIAVAFSYEGGWIKHNQERISRMCAFFRSMETGTYEHYEFADETVIRKIKPYEMGPFDYKELQNRLKVHSIKLGERRSIQIVLKDICGWEFR